MDKKTDKELRRKKRLAKRQGRCYELAFRHVINSDKAKIRLVHGYVSDPQKTVTIKHAWVEEGEGQSAEVYDAVGDERFPRFLYYERFHAVPTDVYSVKEAAKILLKHNHYGPWTE